MNPSKDSNTTERDANASTIPAVTLDTIEGKVDACAFKIRQSLLNSQMLFMRLFFYVFWGVLSTANHQYRGYILKFLVCFCDADASHGAIRLINEVVRMAAC